MAFKIIITDVGSILFYHYLYYFINFNFYIIKYIKIYV